MRGSFILFVLVLLAAPVRADGVLLSTEEDYPGRLLRNRVTRVDVRIHGVIAQTTAYLEFVNEWDRPTDAVFSFPLPDDARAIRMLYQYEGEVYQAVLKVKEQATNPGTGEGGIAAEINEYIGRNGIRLYLADIPAGGVQAVEITYVEALDSDTRRVEYTYPLDTGRFVTHDLDLIQFDVTIASNLPIAGHDVLSHAGTEVLEAEAGTVRLRYVESKGYLAEDFRLAYSVEPDGVTFDAYSYYAGESGGWFATVVRPDSAEGAVLPRHIVFAVNTSSRLAAGLAPAIAAVRTALAGLAPEDRFNIIAFNSRVTSFQSGVVAPTAENLEAAEAFLASLDARHGNQLEGALLDALDSLPEGSGEALPAVVVFTDGRADLDPRAVAAANDASAAIFPVGIGDVDRARLEMLADLNGGFVTYLSVAGNLELGMARVLEQIGAPVLKDPEVSFSTGVTRVSPDPAPSVFAMRPLIVTGRYAEPGPVQVEVSGHAPSGPVTLVAEIEFQQGTAHPFARILWAKREIDRLEREIAVYGPTDALKDSVIALSLEYNVRSRYTAYVADYENVYVPTEAPRVLPARAESRLDGNYPEPFRSGTTVRFWVAPEDAGRVMLLRVYDALGRLIAVIDLTGSGPGWNEAWLDAAGLGRLASGPLFVRLVIGGEVRAAMVMHRVG